MKYPQRTPEHIKDTAGWKLLYVKTPDHWIVRDVTERDYGIDAYIELCGPDGQVRGELCSIQLKSRTGVGWTPSADANDAHTTLSGVKNSTVNYWMGIPVPVFLALADLDLGRVFYAPAKDQVRRNYTRHAQGKGIGFDFRAGLEFGSDSGAATFAALYTQEQTYSRFEAALLALFSHWVESLSFIEENQMRDEFMSVETERVLALEHLYNTCKTIRDYLGLAWPLEPLNEVYDRDDKLWPDPHEALHEGTLGNLLERLEPTFFHLTEAAMEWVTDTHSQYWTRRNLTLWHMCANLDLSAHRRPSDG